MTRVRGIPAHHSSRAREEWCAGTPQETAARAVPGPPDAPEPLTHTPPGIATTVPRGAGSAAGHLRDDTRVAGVAGEAGPCGRGLAADHPAGRP
ncbi:hypothetical protein ACWERI_36550 [Streptomyces collinus]